MGEPVQWVKHIELYVNSSATPPQQAASVDAITSLLKNNLLTLEVLVREMEMYLTTTDNTIRSRGILLLAELLSQLTSKPLNGASIHSLIGFFSERLADWRALRGAIVGCLALLRRKNDVGTVTYGEAKAVAQSFLQNLQVQSLGQQDRKLSFQLMECLLDRHPGAIGDLGDELVYGICEAIDEEKDPQCLVHVFHIIESLARLYPDPSGPLAKFAKDLFEILGSYFPIHFTHRKGEDDDDKREELSRALLLAFASTPLFEPFSIPLLLEKLSSSLPSAKVESFRYISYCATKYGPDRMAKHAQTLWSSVKDVTYFSPQSTLSVESDLMGGMNFEDSDIMMQAFVLLQEIIRQDSGFVNLILGDKDISIFVNSFTEYEGFDDIPVQVRQRLHAVGHILSVCAKSSVALCSKIFGSFFPLLMGALGISLVKPSENSYPVEDCSSVVKLNFGALYLCIELLGACRYLTVSSDNITSIPDFAHETWCAMLSSFSESLALGFFSLLKSNAADTALHAYVYFGVKGLQILATFPGSFFPVSKSLYENILLKLVSIVTSDVIKTFVWTVSLKALVEISFFIDKCPDSERASSFMSNVVDKIVSLITSDDMAIPSSLKLQAAYDIGATRKDFMIRVVQGLDEAISANFTAAYDYWNLESDKLAIELLDTYSHKVLPWFHEIGGSEEIPLKFALNIWDKIENSRSFKHTPPENASNLLCATMTAMKNAVGSCAEEGQRIIVDKSFGVLFSSDCLGSMGLQSGSELKFKELQQIHNSDSSFCKYESLISLFASVIIALRPQTFVPYGKTIMDLFISAVLNGHVPSAHALGSLVNKLPLKKITGIDSPTSISLDKALDMIFSSCIGTSCNCSTSGNDGCEMDFCSLRLNTLRIQSAKNNAVIGLAWIGKGLLMRGHEKIKDITMTLLSFMMLDGNAGGSKQLQNLIEVCDEEDVHQLMKCAGDAFHIIMSDSEECLNRRYHAAIRPLYKQRFFSTIMPILLSLVVKSESSYVRSMLYRAFAHVVADAPLTAILGEAKKLIPVLLDCLSMLSSMLSKDILDEKLIYNLLLIISGILMDKHGQEAVIENATLIINQLIELTAFSRSMAIRETAIQCLIAMSQLPHTRIYPLRTQVLRATIKALDDPKRIVRQEAVRCRQAWASISSRSLHF